MARKNILVVDDGSPDGTGEIADRLSAEHRGRISVMHRTEKSGLGTAYIAGFKQAISMGAEYIIQMDSDFSHQPKYIPDLIAKLRGQRDVQLQMDQAMGLFQREAHFYATFADEVPVRTARCWFVGDGDTTPLLLEDLADQRMGDQTEGMRLADAEAALVVTVEEGTLEGGFGSAVLEAANEAGLDTRNILRLGLPDRFVEHGERGELLAELGLDPAGICAAVRRRLGREEQGADEVEGRAADRVGR